MNLKRLFLILSSLIIIVGLFITLFSKDYIANNEYTKFLCNTAFNILENAILNEKYEDLPMGSLITGLGFGNSSTTLGHALSYVYSNEGYSHGHALAFTTQIAHKFNESQFTERFEKIVKKLSFSPIRLNCSLNHAAELIMKDRKHLDNNPISINKKNIITLLDQIKNLKDVNKSEMIILGILALLVIFFGFYPVPLMETLNVSVDNLINNYETAVQTNGLN